MFYLQTRVNSTSPNLVWRMATGSPGPQRELHGDSTATPVVPRATFPNVILDDRIPRRYSPWAFIVTVKNPPGRCVKNSQEEILHPERSHLARQRPCGTHVSPSCVLVGTTRDEGLLNMSWNSRLNEGEGQFHSA